MALIKCPECGKEISDSAVSCPNCGTPIAARKAAAAARKDQRSGKKAALILLGLILLLGFVGSLTKSRPSSPSTTPGSTTLVDSGTVKAPVPSPAERAAARHRFAEDYERDLLGKGMDFTVRATGPAKRTLRMEWILVGRPLAYQMSNDEKVVRNLQRLGFRRLIMTDGHDESYSVTIDPLPGDEDPPAAAAARKGPRPRWVADPKLEVFYYSKPECGPAQALLRAGGYQTFATADDALGAGFHRSGTKGCDD